MIFEFLEALRVPNSGRIGLTSGCFDLLHYYHLRFLERCRAQCDTLIVGVDSDLLIAATKAKMPAIPEHHRVAMVAALRCVDAAWVMTSRRQFKCLANQAHTVFRNRLMPDARDYEQKLIVVPDIHEPHSTGEILNQIRSARESLSHAT